jgi:oxalate---CoA ligase
MIPSLGELLEERAARAPGASALCAPGRTALRYGPMLDRVRGAVDSLASLGLGRGDRIATVLPAGAEATLAFLSVASCATAAPLNPALRAGEFEQLFSDLNPTALLTAPELDVPVNAARDVARARGVPVVELTPSRDGDGEAGAFALEGARRRSAARAGFANVDECALILGTSGTTAGPKYVALTHRNLIANARNIASAFGLTERDRCLNVMPLFHAHGLVIALLSSLASGGGVIAPAGFDPTAVAGWLREFSPTWYTASPTLHEAVVEQAERRPGDFDGHTLRFVRSSAAPLSSRLAARMEVAFRIPVVEAYGMTECAQIASTPLGGRKSGSVGIPAGPEVAVLDGDGRPLPAESAGEIAIRGEDCVFASYATGSSDGRTPREWFRTGDEGLLDADGYLFVTGRVKEFINRGGQKVSPYEVEGVLLAHPSVLRAAVFAIPHPRLVENVAAAVVTRGNATEGELRAFALERLADFKVPSRIVVVDAIPAGPTGKVKRVGLAEALGLAGADARDSEGASGGRDVEARIAAIWAEVLEYEGAGFAEADDFFRLGGDSILATQVVSRIRRDFGVEIPVHGLFETPALGDFASAVRRAVEAGGSRPGPAIEPALRTARRPNDTPAVDPERSRTVDDVRFSLFFFSADGATEARDKYALVLESARFADRRGFTAVWTPERHFSAFGGLYPNPSVLGAAVGAVTERIRVRAGSVVLPLQDPVRVAEEWSIVDNLSGGRVDVAFASGWHPNDFVLAPDRYDGRKALMFERIETVRRLWRGDEIRLPNGAGNEVAVRTLPRPVQPELPVWLTSHSDETFVAAGEAGFNVLSNLYRASPEDIARQIRLYRDAWVRGGHGGRGVVTLMMHTFVGENDAAVRKEVESAYQNYFRIFLRLKESQAQGLALEFGMAPGDTDFLVSEGIERVLGPRGLIGTPEVCAEKIRALRAIGVDEIACLVDFGVPLDATMASLERLDAIRSVMGAPNERPRG